MQLHRFTLAFKCVKSENKPLYFLINYELPFNRLLCDSSHAWCLTNVPTLFAFTQLSGWGPSGFTLWSLPLDTSVHTRKKDMFWRYDISFCSPRISYEGSRLDIKTFVSFVKLKCKVLTWLSIVRLGRILKSTLPFI